MDKDEVKKIFAEFGINNPVVEFNNNYYVVGSVDTNGKFELSKQALKYNDYKGKRAIIGHEAMHIPEFNHGKKFRKSLDDNGIDEKEIVPITRYLIFCPRCKEFARLNKLKHKDYLCGYCKKKDIKQKLMVYKHVKNRG